MLAVRDLGLRIGGAEILRGVTLDVADGEFLAVIGPNGAGKTSMFNLLSGLIPATSGTIALARRDITRYSPARRSRAGLGRTFQTSSVFAGLPVRENVRLAAEAGLGGTARIWRRAEGVAAAVERAEAALERVGLTARAGILAGGLSHGDKRKLELAILLAGGPAVLLLDEPMAGVSAENVDELVEVIRGIHHDEGKTVLMVEHHMHVVLGLADRVAVLHRGELLLVGSPEQVMADQTVQAAYLGTAA